MRALYPQAAVLVHPESPQAIVDMADAVGSTSQLINAAKTLPHKQLIVATDRGIFYKMQQAVPEKELLEAPTAGEGATWRSCPSVPRKRRPEAPYTENMETPSFHQRPL